MITIKRWSGNPILAPRDNYWEKMQIRNPAAVRYRGKVFLVYTARTAWNTIYLGLAASRDGLHFERASDLPWYSPSKDGFDAGTVEDARVVQIDYTFYITYAARSIGKEEYAAGRLPSYRTNDHPTWTRNWRRGGLLATKNFKTVKCLGPITSASMYDCNIILFPEKVGGRYVLLHRPTPYEPLPEHCVRHPERRGEICISFSKDLLHWSGTQVLARPEFPWENIKIGGSVPPIWTPQGWLLLYHGVQGTSTQDMIYRVGVMLLDLQDPTKVLARSPHFIMEPEKDYEKNGTVPNVVFPNGAVVIDGLLHIYYGGADTVCAVATVPLAKLLDYVLSFRGTYGSPGVSVALQGGVPRERRRQRVQ